MLINEFHWILIARVSGYSVNDLFVRTRSGRCWRKSKLGCAKFCNIDSVWNDSGGGGGAGSMMVGIDSKLSLLLLRMVWVCFYLNVSAIPVLLNHSDFLIRRYFFSFLLDTRFVLSRIPRRLRYMTSELNRDKSWLVLFWSCACSFLKSFWEFHLLLSVMW